MKPRPSSVHSAKPGVLESMGISSGAARMLRRITLRAFLGLVALNAFVAIVAILGGGGDSEWQILGTSSVVSAGSLGIAANTAALERRRLGWLPVASAVAVAITCALLVALIWNIGPDDEGHGKLVGTLATLAVGGTYLSMIGLPRLGRGWRSIQIGAQLAAGALVVTTIGSIYADSAAPFEIFAILAVLIAAGTIVVAVGTRVSPDSPQGPTIADARAVHCPVCAALVRHQPADETTCPTCGSRFRLTVTLLGSPPHEPPAAPTGGWPS